VLFLGLNGEAATGVFKFGGETGHDLEEGHRCM
jgi:hypothetical protein